MYLNDMFFVEYACSTPICLASDWCFFSLQDFVFHPKALKGVKGSIACPMPGEVLKVRVQVGDTVEKGQSLAVISAMKMEMAVKSPVAGVVKSISAAEGMKLQGDDLIMDIE